MNKRTGTALIGILAVGAVALAGCAQPSASAAPSTVETTQEEHVTNSPLVATATPTPTPEAATPEEAFIAEITDVRANSPYLKTQIPDATPEQLLAAGYLACEQIAAGVDVAVVQVIEGEVPNDLGVYPDSAIIAAVASRTICG